MGITIKELSEMSGYSPATISRVIANKGNVKKDTREAIEKLLLENNYRTNIMELRTSELKRKTIMIIVGDLDNTYYTELIKIIKNDALERGYTTLIAFSDNSIEEEEHFVNMAIKEKYAGIVFINVRGESDIAELLIQSEIPVIFLNRGIRFYDFNSVTSDNYEGGYLITSYLIGMGHRKIGHFMGPTYSMAAQERRRGYEDAMNDKGLAVTNNSIFSGELSWSGGYECGERMIKKGLDYTAVFCGNYSMAMGLVDALRDYDIKIPEDISVVCYDDTLFTEKYGLTIVGAEVDKLGRKAIDLLVSNIEGRTSDGGSVVYKPKIIVRNSVKKVN